MLPGWFDRPRKGGMAALYPRSAKTLLTSGLIAAALAGGGVAFASNPTYTTLTVPGDQGPTTGSWQGASLQGVGDPTGQRADPCPPGSCDEEQIIPISRDPAYTKKHTLTVTLWIDYGGPAGAFDVYLLDPNHTQVPGASIAAVKSGQKLVVHGIQLDNYYFQIDAHFVQSPTSYVGHVMLSANNVPTSSSVPPPTTSPAPPVSPTGGTAVGPPPGNTSGSTVGPSIGGPTGSPKASSSGTPFGSANPIPPAHPEAASSGLGKWWIVIGLGVLALAYLATKVLRRS